MSNALQKPEASPDPFDNYRRERRRALLGSPLKFVKGDYFIGNGADAVLMPTNTQLIAAMRLYTLGWQLWMDGERVDQRLGFFVDGFVPQPRHALGLLDKSQWKIGLDGRPQDPWQKFRGIPMINPQDRALYTFVTGSDGGLRAVDDLCEEYRDAHANLKHALISIGGTSYMHRDRKIGRVKKPIFPLIGIVEDGAIYDAILKAEGDETKPALVERPAAGKLIEITSGKPVPQPPAEDEPFGGPADLDDIDF